jgi:hypothetical protein
MVVQVPDQLDAVPVQPLRLVDHQKAPDPRQLLNQPTLGNQPKLAASNPRN